MRNYIKSDNVLINKLNKYRNLLFIVFILLFNIVLRALCIDVNPIELDEPFSIFYSQMDIPEIIHQLKDGNNPPLYEILLHLWIKIFGISSFAVRFPSLLFSVLNIFFIYLISKRFFNSRVVILSVILVTFSNYHIYFSHEARVYTLFALLTTISFYLLLLILENKYSFYNLLFLFITYVGLIFSHYFGIFVIAFQTILFFSIELRNIDRLKKYFLVIACLLLTYAYYIPIVIKRFTDSSKNGTWLQPVKTMGTMYDLIYAFSNKNRWLYLVFILLLWSGVWKYFYQLKTNKYIKGIILFGIIPLFFLTGYSIFFSIPYMWRLTLSFVFIKGFVTLILFGYIYLGIKKINIKTEQYVIVGWFLVPLILFFSVSFKIPIFLDRYLIFIMPAFYITLSLIINYIFQSKVSISIFSILLISIMIFSFNLNESNNRFANDIIIQTKKLKTPNTKIIICPKYYNLTFSYYYNKESFKDYNNFNLNLHKENIYPVYSQNELNNILSPSDKIIYIDAHADVLYPKNGIYNRLINNYKLITKIVFPDSSILYEFKKNNKIVVK